jgi:hypothetical protein
MSEFEAIRAALYKIASDLWDTESYSPRPCPDYLAYMGQTVAAIRAAESVADLVAVDWVSGQAALGAEML